MHDPVSDAHLRIVAATAALPYVHKRAGNVTDCIKNKRTEGVQEAGKGKFAPTAPPKSRYLDISKECIRHKVRRCYT